MGKLYFTMGLARSGKSTWIKDFKLKNPRIIVLSGDDFRYAVYNKRFEFVGEALVRGTLLTAARALLIGDNDVLVEDTNTSMKSVQELLNIDENAKAFFFTTPLETCLERAVLTGQPDLIPSIRRMQRNLEITAEAIEAGVFTIKEIEVVV